MKKIAIFLVCVGIVALASGQQEMNDVNVEKRDVKSFHAIKVSSAFDVYLSQGNEEAVAVSASEERFREHIKTEVKNGVLTIWYDNGWKSITEKKKLKAYISFKELDKLDVGGSCDFFIVGTLKVNELSINLSGASDMEGKVDVGKLSVDISGASDIKITGIASQVSIDASGASDFKGYDLVTEVCNAKASGASDIHVTVNKELSAHATGASNVRYKGSGVVKELKTNGASSVNKS